MKSYLIAAAGLMLAIAVPFSSIAQGRHDEKPHGMMKPAHEVSQQDRATTTGGRHDEGGTTHGKTTAKKESGKSDKSSTGQ